MEVWLTLSEAAAQLGIHPSTLRRWTDEGRIRARRTPGGHRRYAQQEILRQNGSDRESSPVGAVVAPRQDEPWKAAFQPADRVDLRHVGQRLLGMLTQYLTDREGDSGLLDESREIGRHYGMQSAASGMQMIDLIRAFLHFRDRFIDLMVQQPTFTRPVEAERIHILYKRMDKFMGQVLLGAVEGYLE